MLKIGLWVEILVREFDRAGLNDCGQLGSDSQCNWFTSLVSLASSVSVLCVGACICSMILSALIFLKCLDTSRESLSKILWSSRIVGSRGRKERASVG